MITKLTMFIIQTTPKEALSLIPIQRRNDKWSGTLWISERTPSDSIRPRLLVSDDREWNSAKECLKEFRASLKEQKVELPEK